MIFCKEKILTDIIVSPTSKKSDNNQEMPDNPGPQWKANPHWKTTKEDGVRSDVWLFIDCLNSDHPMNSEKNGNYTHICLLPGCTYKGGAFIKSGKNGQKRTGGISFQTTQAKRHLEGSHPDFASYLSKKKSLHKSQVYIKCALAIKQVSLSHPSIQLWALNSLFFGNLSGI